MRKLAAAAVRFLKPKGIRKIAIALADGAFTGADFVSAAVEGAILGDYEPDRYKPADETNSRWRRLPIAGGDARRRWNAAGFSPKRRTLRAPWPMNRPIC